MFAKLPLQLTCIGAAWAVLAGPTLAQNTLETCVSLSDPAERLACFDAAMSARSAPPAPGRAAAAPVVPEAPRSASPAAPVSAPVSPVSPAEAVIATQAAPAPEKFGLELRDQDQTSDAERSLRVLAARHNDFTGWTIEFDDGSIWKQIGTDRYSVEVGKTYTIRRGSLNSFQLGNPDNNRKIRVRREE